MDCEIKFEGVNDTVLAGEKILGKVRVISSETIVNCRLDIFFKGKERINLRRLADNSSQCEDVKTSHSICDEKFSTQMTNSSDLTEFSFSVSSKCPGSFKSEHFHDTAAVSYRLLAKLYSDNEVIKEDQVPINVIPDSSGAKAQAFKLPFKRCCCSYGIVEVTNELHKLSFSAQEPLISKLNINNEKGRGKLQRVTFELWKTVKIRYSDASIDMFTELVFRENEEICFSLGESLLAEGTINLQIDLNKYRKKILENYSTRAELVNCEYELRAIFHMKTLCGLANQHISIPLFINP